MTDRERRREGCGKLWPVELNSPETMLGLLTVMTSCFETLQRSDLSDADRAELVEAFRRTADHLRQYVQIANDQLFPDWR